MNLSKSIEAFVLQCSPTETGSTRESYRNSLKRFLVAAEVADLAGLRQIDSDDFLRVVHILKKTYKPGTVGLTVVAVRQFYGFLRLDDRSIVNPTIGFRSKPFDNVPDQNVLHEGDPALLLASITDPRDRAVITTLTLQGWRVSDLCHMKWGNIRPGKEPGTWIAEFKSKRGKLRTQGIQRVVIEMVHALGDARGPNDPFLAAPGGGAFSRFNLYYLVTRYSELFGRRVTPHGLRATYISSVISRKGIEAARQLAGHRSITTTQRYSRWAIESDDPLTMEDV